MKILVVDDEHSFGALLGHTLKRLGHKPVVTTHPEDALELLTPDVDAVITDIDMPVMTGVELAKAIRARRNEMPIAFCTGSAPEGRALREASEIGKVLPKVWTVADVKAVVEGLRKPLAPRKHPRASAVSHLYADLEPERAGRPGPESAKPRRRKVRVAFRTWNQVLRLCRDAERGRVQVTVPGPDDLDPGCDVNIALVLPEEITVKIAGIVQAVRPRRGERPEIVIELSGLTEELRVRLEILAGASQSATPKPSLSSYLHVSPQVARRGRNPKGTPPDPALARGSRKIRVSEILRDNRHLRQKIEGLAVRMQPREDDE